MRQRPIKPYYEHAGITIYHGDCRGILPQLPKGWCANCQVVMADEQVISIHLAAKHLVGPLASVAVTDPPYGIGWTRGSNPARNSKPHDGIIGDDDTSVRDEVLAQIGIPAIVFGSFYAPWPPLIKQVLVWRKPADSGVVGSTTGYRRDAEPIFLVGDWPMRDVAWSSVLSGSRGMSAITTETGHPHTKPVELLIKLIDQGLDGGICDPFCGSGSTLIAAKRLGRRAIGIEIEEKYCEIAAKRLSQEVFDFK